MNKLKHIFLTLAILMGAFSMNAQTIIDLRLNEILIKNEDNLTDEYGCHSAWVEIYNTSFNSVNLGGCFLTNDTTGLAAAQKDKNKLNEFKAACYGIPTGDPLTLLQQRSCAVFFLDGIPTYGTFHTNFTPDNSNYVALIGSDGKTLIDIITFPDRIRFSGESFGCEIDGVVAENRDNSIFAKKHNDDQRTILKHSTPGSNNKILSGENKADKLIKNDPYGIMMAIMSMTIVFSVLVIIYIVLKLFGHFTKKNAAKTAAPKAAVKTTTPGGKPTDEELAAIALALNNAGIGADEEEIAAISMALYLYLDTQHDQESEVITFNTNNNSTWGQKHFNFKQDPR